MKPFQVSPRAQADLDEAWDWIAKSSPRAATGWLQKVHKNFRFLSQQPLLGEACPQIRADLRRFVVGQYVIYYRIRDNDIEIVRVLHGARDVDAIFRNE
jgi:toxin ParE1/3/4